MRSRWATRAIFVSSVMCVSLVVAGCDAAPADMSTATDYADVPDGSEPSPDSVEGDDLALRPNFIFLVADDMRYEATGEAQRRLGDAGRFPWMRGRTPNIDRIASEGVTFTNAFVVSSLCSPSRASFLTGQYGHINGVFDNHTPFPIGSVTHASVLRHDGYVTGYFGKWHMGDQRARPGFTHAASFIGQGEYFDTTYVVDGVDTPTTGWVDDVTTDFALRFVRENADRPFSMVVGFKSPHGPYTPPDRLSHAFSGIEVQEPPNHRAFAPWDPTPELRTMPIDRFRDYFSCIAGVDENVGRILDALDRLHIARRTVVVFSSDNGYFLSEHSLADKRAAYEEAMRIPMYMRYPRGAPAGVANQALVLNIDLAPTFISLAGAGVPAGMQGASWQPLLAGTSPRLRDGFLYEYYLEQTDVPTLVAYRGTHRKLVHYPGHFQWNELFELTNDPYERHNIIATNPGVLADMSDRLAAAKRDVSYTLTP